MARKHLMLKFTSSNRGLEYRVRPTAPFRLSRFVTAAFTLALALLCVSPVAASDLADYSQPVLDQLLEGRITFRVAGLHGIADTSGKVIIEPRYTQLQVFSKDRAFAIRDGVGGFLSMNGAFESLPALTELLASGARVQYLSSRNLFHVRIREKEGLCDQIGRWVVPAEYAHLAPGRDKGDPIAFRKDGEAGFIDEAGKRLLGGLKSAIVVDSRIALGSRTVGTDFEVIDYGGRAVLDRRFRILAPVGEGVYYGQEEPAERNQSVVAGYYRIENGRARMVVPTFYPSPIARFSEGRVFACEDPSSMKNSETRGDAGYVVTMARSMSGTCNYYDQHGRRYFEKSYTNGSAFKKGKAVACRSDLRTRKRTCAWLAVSGHILVEAEVDGTLWQQLADDRVAILLGGNRWTLFYSDGSKRVLSKH